MQLVRTTSTMQLYKLLSLLRKCSHWWPLETGCVVLNVPPCSGMWSAHVCSNVSWSYQSWQTGAQRVDSLWMSLCGTTKSTTSRDTAQRDHPGMWPGPAASRGLIFLGAPNNLLIYNFELMIMEMSPRDFPILCESKNVLHAVLSNKSFFCCTPSRKNPEIHLLKGLTEFIYIFSLQDDDKREKSKSLQSLTYRAFMSHLLASWAHVVPSDCTVYTNESVGRNSCRLSENLTEAELSHAFSSLTAEMEPITAMLHHLEEVRGRTWLYWSEQVSGLCCTRETRS